VNVPAELAQQGDPDIPHIHHLFARLLGIHVPHRKLDVGEQTGQTKNRSKIAPSRASESIFGMARLRFP